MAVDCKSNSGESVRIHLLSNYLFRSAEAVLLRRRKYVRLQLQHNRRAFRHRSALDSSGITCVLALAPHLVRHRKDHLKKEKQFNRELRISSA